MDLVNELLAKKQKLKKTIESENKLLKSSNEIQLRITKIKGSYFWRYTDPQTGKRVNISKKDRKMAEELGMNTYLRYKADYDVNLFNAICAFEKVYGNSIPPEEYLDANPGIAELVCPRLNTKDKAWRKWESDSYEKYTGRPEGLKIKTLKGDLVRSKSEMIIADALFKNGVPYRYECVLHYDGGMLAPDFNAACMSQSIIKFWEHAGLIDDDEYAESFIKKLRIYSKLGIRLGKELIVTTETADNPLDSDYVQYLIEHNFK